MAGQALVFTLEEPACEWLGAGPKAVALDGPLHNFQFSAGGQALNGVHGKLAVIPAERAAPLWVAGDLGSGASVGVDADRRVLLDVEWGRCVPEQKVNLHATVEHPEWVQHFVLHADGSLGPAKARELVLGVSPAGAHPVVLVPRADPRRLRLAPAVAARVPAAAGEQGCTSPGCTFLRHTHQPAHTSCCHRCCIRKT